MTINIDFTKHVLKKTWLSILLSPISNIFTVVLFCRRKLMRWGQFHAPICIVSIGNVVSGGSGKTPTTMSIVKLLSARGYRVAVSHRGYLGKFESNPTLISNQSCVYDHAAEAGDEAYLLALKLSGVPVVVGKNRKAAIKLLLVKHPDLQIIVLDDSFQHLKVYHDIDIITFSSDVGIGNGYVLPAGYLREPLTAIQANHIALINHKDPTANLKHLLHVIKKRTNNVFTASLCVERYYNCQGRNVAIEDIRELPLILMSGIAFPKSFLQTAVNAGLKIYKSYQYSDHYAFEDIKQIQSIADFCKSHGIKYILTTEKDYVKLKKYEVIQSMLVVCAITYKIENQKVFEDLLVEKIEQAGKLRI